MIVSNHPWYLRRCRRYSQGFLADCLPLASAAALARCEPVNLFALDLHPACLMTMAAADAAEKQASLESRLQEDAAAAHAALQAKHDALLASETAKAEETARALAAEKEARVHAESERMAAQEAQATAAAKHLEALNQMTTQSEARVQSMTASMEAQMSSAEAAAKRQLTTTEAETASLQTRYDTLVAQQKADARHSELWADAKKSKDGYRVEESGVLTHRKPDDFGGELTRLVVPHVRRRYILDTAHRGVGQWSLFIPQDAQTASQVLHLARYAQRHKVVLRRVQRMPASRQAA